MRAAWDVSDVELRFPQRLLRTLIKNIVVTVDEDA